MAGGHSGGQVDGLAEGQPGGQPSSQPVEQNFGKVVGLYVGDGKGEIKRSCLSLELTTEGIVGDRHAGALRKADVRDRGVERGTLIRNWRQWSAISVEELEEIGKNLFGKSLAPGAPVDPSYLGPNMLISGIAGFSRLAVGTILRLPHAELLVEGENEPCVKVGKVLVTQCGVGDKRDFVRAGRHLRGLVGSVRVPGMIAIGDQVVVVK